MNKLQDLEFLILEGCWEKALEFIDSLDDDKRKDSQIQAALGIICLNMQEYQKADDFFQTAIKTDPGNGEHYYNLGYLHFVQDHFTTAESNFESALKLGVGDELKTEIMEFLRKIKERRVPQIEDTVENSSILQFLRSLNSSLQNLKHIPYNKIGENLKSLEYLLMSFLNVLSIDSQCYHLASEILKHLESSQRVLQKEEKRNIIDELTGLESLIKERLGDMVYYYYRYALFHAYLMPLDYDYFYLKNKTEDIISSGTLETLVTGLSYSRNGIDDTKLKNAANLSSTGQDLYYSFLINKMLLPHCPNLKVSLIGMAYYSFHYDLSAGKKAATVLPVLKTLYPLTHEKHHNQFHLEGPLHALEPLIQKVAKESMGILEEKSLYNRVRSDFQMEYGPKYFNAQMKWTKNYGCYVFEALNQEQIKQVIGERTADHNKLLKYKETHREYTNILKDFVQYLLNQNVRPVFVILPCCKEYRDGLNPEMKKIFYQTLEELPRNSYKLWDYFDCPLFTHNDFVDPDHLSEYGCAKMTEIIRRRMEG